MNKELSISLSKRLILASAVASLGMAQPARAEPMQVDTQHCSGSVHLKDGSPASFDLFNAVPWGAKAIFRQPDKPAIEMTIDYPKKIKRIRAGNEDPSYHNYTHDFSRGYPTNELPILFDTDITAKSSRDKFIEEGCDWKKLKMPIDTFTVNATVSPSTIQADAGTGAIPPDMSDPAIKRIFRSLSPK